MRRVFKNDRYKKSRGGRSRLLDISCRECGFHVCYYQKDGPGNLRRMYVDRIIDSQAATNKKDLSCKNGHLLGVKMIYKKEGRPAFRLFVDSVTKKVCKL